MGSKTRAVRWIGAIAVVGFTVGVVWWDLDRRDVPPEGLVRKTMYRIIRIDDVFPIGALYHYEKRWSFLPGVDEFSAYE